jgi:hypothetical protein
MIPNPQQYHMTRLRRVPSAAHSPSDLRVRLGAGTRDVSTFFSHRRQQMT